MSYLLDKKTKKKKFSQIFFLVVIFLFLFYFRSNIWRGLAYSGHTLARPVLALGSNVGEKISNINSYFISKNSLEIENKNLKLQLEVIKTAMTNYNSLLSENVSLKEILGRKAQTLNIVLSAILAKPNQSPYDTLIVDAGINQGIDVGSTVFALGDVPIGKVSDVYQNSSKVILFSNRGEKNQVVLSNSNIFMEVVGRGGGNFEMIVPRDLALSKGDQVVLPGIVPYVLGIVETIISDPRDPFIKALLVSPVNVQELKFVEIKK